MNKDIKKNLFEFLYSSQPEYQEYIEFLEYEIHERVYYYGDQFKNHRDNRGVLSKIKFLYKHFKVIIYTLILSFLNKKELDKKSGLSSSYLNYDEQLESKDLIIDRLPWAPKLGRPMNISINDYLKFLKIDYRLNFYNTYDLISLKNIESIKEFKSFFKEYVIKNNYSFLIVPGDLDFWSRMAISVFNELNMPSICVAHGWMPSEYVGVSDSKVSHTAKWGEFEKNAYINSSFNPNNITTIGHPAYKLNSQNLKFSFENILVLTKSMAGVVLAKEKFIEDRGNTIMYLMAIQSVLEDLEIKNVFLRPHPCENFDWYKNFIDNDFFIEDKQDLHKSLKSKTLVIGPKSTTLIDSIAHGVNYVIFEPVIDNKDILGSPISEPIDGSNKQIPVASNIKQLNEILVNRSPISHKAFDKILNAPFDTDFLNKVL